METQRSRSPFMRRRRVAALAAVLLSSALAVALVARARGDDDADDVDRLMKGLALQAGMTAAEIGAGSGTLSIALARELGPGGRLFTSELGADRLGKLRTAVEAAHADNVTVVEGAAAETRLPEGCCDAIFMRDVYHHFADPDAMNQSLLRSLRPCGRLAILDFRPGGRESATPAGRAGGDGAHGVTIPTLKGELSRAGFEILVEDPAAGRNFLIVARRPATDGQPAGNCPAGARSD